MTNAALLYSLKKEIQTFRDVFRGIEREHWQTEKQTRKVIKNIIVAFCG